MNPKTPGEILKQYFGYDSFRGSQEEIISQVIAGGDALVLMPTGGGKSICYQIPAIIRQGTGIVVSPLIALMQNQVEALLQAGVRAGFLNSSLSQQEAFTVEQQVVRGELDLLYVAPERLMTQGFQELLSHTRISLFAIDEAHCVSQWGHDFRPEYMQLSILAERFPAVPRIALTATADAIVRNEITTKLNLNNARCFISSFDRPNIFYRVLLKKSVKKQLTDFLYSEHSGDSGIVYCLSRRKVESTAEWLCEEGFKALPYHAGMTQETRAANQRRFLNEDSVIIVATIAFGMGIDKPDVRFVVHLDLPKNLESYYQETGRAGRDGKKANAWMAYSLSDVVFLRQMLASSEGSEEFKRIQQQKLNAMLGFCEITVCRRKVLLSYFGEKLAADCGNCDTCREETETWDGSVIAQKALSCVYRTGQRFGAGYLIDVLLGRNDQRITNFGHDKVSTFGIGKELLEAEWKSVFRQLIGAGYLNVDTANGGFHLNENSLPVLRGETDVFFRKDPIPTKKSRKKSGTLRGKATTMIEEALSDEGSRILWKKLKTFRTETAKENNIPPYVIFHDSTLSELIENKPVSRDEMLRISGIGLKKFDSYGESIIGIIQEHLADNQETGS